MSSSLKSLRISAQLSSALGLLSLTLTGEIATVWLTAGWAAWTFSLFSSHFSKIERTVRKLETAAVVLMVLTLFVDFLGIHTTLFLAITHFLLLFQIVKLIGEKGRKDFLQIFLFSFFQILAACTLSVDAWHAGVLLALIPIGTFTLYWNQIEQERERFHVELSTTDSRRYRRMAWGISAAALPVHIVLTTLVFVIFPRLTVNAPIPGFVGRRAGYTDQINLAQKGELSQDSAVTMWLAFPRPEERQLWDGFIRGEVLSQFDGRSWTPDVGRSKRMISGDSNNIFLIHRPRPNAQTIRQSITLTNTAASTLFVIAQPFRVIAPMLSIQESEGGSLHGSVHGQQPLRYDVVSELAPDMNIRPADLKLPPITLGRIRALARQVAGSGTPAAQAEKIENYLRTHYRYTASFGDHVAANPVEDFLFDRREGLCGHFASAMALMLRLQHIPSRIVAGYLKGEWNEPAQCVVIRERDAHAWVEAYLPKEGWVTFDPSPRQAPGSGANHRSLWWRAVQYGDYLDLQWNRFIIEYDLYSQIKALENLKGTTDRFGAGLASLWTKLERSLPTRSLKKLSPLNDTASDTRNTKSLARWAVGVGLAIGALILLRRHRSKNRSYFAFYEYFLESMTRNGFPKHTWETGEEFAARVAQEKSELSERTQQVTQTYYKLRYGHKKN